MTDTLKTGRLPRYKRAAGDVSLVLTARDLEILRLVQSFRLLTSEHIQALTGGSDQNILRRLQKLFHAGYLDRLSPRLTPNGGSAKMIYAITNKGVATLQKEGVLKEVSTTDLNAQNRGLHDFSIDHRLLISHIRATFMLACQGKQRCSNPRVNASTSHATHLSGCQGNQNLEFLFWREGREIYDTIEVALPNTYARLPVAPDGFFATRDAQGRTHYFVEADRGTMTLKRFTQKLLAYAAYWKAKRHTEKFKIKHFRVLTVTSSALRCENLTRAAAASTDVRDRARMFLFTSEDKLALARPESVFEKIWTVPGTQELCSILGQSQSKNPAEKENVTPMQINSNAHTEVRHGP
jgi:hypothetical protein